MAVTPIVEGIYNVGVADWNIRDFHGHSTHCGTTYNAFLIIDDKITLIDTVKKEFTDELLANIARIIDPQKIDYVVSNHTEMDHSGGLPRVMHKIGEDKPIYISKMGYKNHRLHFSQPWNYQVVENGQTLSLGKRTLTFLETRMLHWPDSMFTYVAEDRLLFSSDAFGQHYAGPEQFDDEMGEAIMPHARKYFANILLLYTEKIKKLLASVKEMGLALDIICPDHGVIWRTEPQKIIQAYADWSRHEGEPRAVVIYDSMWHSTEKMAEKIAEGISEEGPAAIPLHLKHCDRSEVMTEVMRSRAVVVGSPTLNNQMFPTVMDMLIYMKGLKPRNKVAAAFGSYGWSGEAVKQIKEILTDMKLDLIEEPGLKIQYVPDDQGIADCLAFGRRIGRAIKKGPDQ